MIPIPVGRYTPHETWRELMEHREKAMAHRHQLGHERWSEHVAKLPALKIGDKVFVQNQVGNHPRHWGKTGTVVEVLQHDQYRVRVDGSGRVTLRNRKYLRKYVPFCSSPPSPPVPGPKLADLGRKPVHSPPVPANPPPPPVAPKGPAQLATPPRPVTPIQPVTPPVQPARPVTPRRETPDAPPVNNASPPCHGFDTPPLQRRLVFEEEPRDESPPAPRSPPARPQQSPAMPRRSSRTVRPPAHLQDYVTKNTHLR